MRLFASVMLLFLLMAQTGCMTVGQRRAGIDNFDQVSPTLYRGAQPSEEGIRTLASYKVGTVLNLRAEDDSREAKMVRDAGMTYLHLPLEAETVTVADAEKILALIADAPKPVFVHCHVGRDRTGLAVAAYRMHFQGWTLQAAVADMYNHGHFWLLFPKVRGVLAELPPALPATPAAPIVVTPAPGDE
jgi:uncharacterized protein (TIGR01244 family)